MKQLHLTRVHRSLGAEFAPFAGWEMPMKYVGIAEEHVAVREAVGLFDVSHMGEILVKGRNSLDFLQRVTTNDVFKLSVGGAHYSTILNERGGTKDDVVIFRLAEREFMVVCNAVNVEKICGWLRRHAGDGIELENITMTTVLLALQGPKAQRVLQSLTSFDVSQLRRFRFVFTKVAGVEIILSRTGYTGEDGFELFITDEPQSNPERGEKLWNALLRAGEGVGIKPCGLGARNTTRLEAGMCLYGHELTEEITPLEAHLDFVVKFEKGGFIGRAALLEQKAKGLSKLRVGLRMLERGIPRKGHEVFRDASKVGFVTSGTFSPLLKTGIAMAYLNPQVSAGEIEVEIHGKRRRGQVVNFPFYDPNEYGARRKRVA